jgi:hypothetical protein
MKALNSSVAQGVKDWIAALLFILIALMFELGSLIKRFLRGRNQGSSRDSEWRSL